MDPQLPRLDDFKAIEAEPPKPERWWVRYASYLYLSLLCGMGYGGYTFLKQNGVIGDFAAHSRLSAYTVAERNELIRYRTGRNAVIGIIIGISIAYSLETTRKKCPPKTSKKD